MTKFRLLGNTTVFTAARFFLAGGFVPAVVGVTECGRYQTVARVADVVALA